MPLKEFLKESLDVFMKETIESEEIRSRFQERIPGNNSDEIHETTLTGSQVF